MPKHPAARPQKSHGPSGAYAAIVQARAVAQAPYVPPAGFPADPGEWLSCLQAGKFTPEQVRYLHSNALAIYEAGITAARGDPALATAVALGEQIIAAWKEAAAANPAPPSGNPFGA